MSTDIEAVIFDIGNVLIEWQPERYYDATIGEDRRRAMFAEVDLHGMNDRVDLGEGFRDVIYETAEAYPHGAPRSATGTTTGSSWPPLPSPFGAADAALRAKGVPVFALTNFGIESFAYAQTQYDFLNEFDRPYVSGHMRVIKPDPASTRWWRRIAACPGGSLLFADDRADNIDAARARGGRRISSKGRRAGPRRWSPMAC
jgi:2-haloacid dehalogenase